MNVNVEYQGRVAELTVAHGRTGDPVTVRVEKNRVGRWMTEKRIGFGAGGIGNRGFNTLDEVIEALNDERFKEVE